MIFKEVISFIIKVNVRTRDERQRVILKKQIVREVRAKNGFGKIFRKIGSNFFF